MPFTNLEVCKNDRKNLRSNDFINLKIPKCNKTNFGQRSFNYLAPKYWNALPNDIKSTTNRTNFIKSIKMKLYQFEIF